MYIFIPEFVVGIGLKMYMFIPYWVQVPIRNVKCYPTIAKIFTNCKSPQPGISNLGLGF